jgi:D-galactarolactone cycloisomerase
MKIISIRLDRMRLPLDRPFAAAWDPVPRRQFVATLVRVTTDAGITGYGSGDTTGGFGAFAQLFIGTDPLQVANHVRVLETLSLPASAGLGASIDEDAVARWSVESTAY